MRRQPPTIRSRCQKPQLRSRVSRRVAAIGKHPGVTNLDLFRRTDPAISQVGPERQNRSEAYRVFRKAIKACRSSGESFNPNS